MANAVTPYVDGQVWDDQDANWSVGFGDGTDGAFNETAASTTNLVQGTVNQFTSFNLGSAHTISASSNSDEPIIIYVSGNATIDGTISLTAKGQLSAIGYYGLASDSTPFEFASPGKSVNAVSGGAGGKRGGPLFNFQQNQISLIINGTGGGVGDGGGGAGGGASSANTGATGSSGSAGGGAGGAGGAGGCTIIMIIGGTLTFGASSSIDVSGGDGSATADGAGGGGGAGDILIFHRGTKTDNGLTTDVTGGAGGSSSGGTGGAGGAGTSKIVNYDTIFWGK